MTTQPLLHPAVLTVLVLLLAITLVPSVVSIIVQLLIIPVPVPVRVPPPVILLVRHLQSNINGLGSIFIGCMLGSSSNEDNLLRTHNRSDNKGVLCFTVMKHS